MTGGIAATRAPTPHHAPRPRPARALLTLLALLTLIVAGLGADCAEAGSLRFFGHGGRPGDAFAFPDRVKIPSAPPAAVNVGASDFTIEFFLRATAAENPNGPASCGAGIAWVEGHVLIDRDRFDQGRKWGISLLGGRVAFGVSNDAASFTLCGTTDVLDDRWHHVAVDRRASDGRMRVWIDGRLDAQAPGGANMPSGDVSYPASAVPGPFCSPDGGAGSAPCSASDPFLVLGAEKHGFSGINFSGALDEIRLSNGLRHEAAFAVPSSPYSPDPATAALYHLDETTGDVVADASGRGGTGTRHFGGTPPPGPIWQADSPFLPALPGPAADPGGALVLALALALCLFAARTGRIAS